MQKKQCGLKGNLLCWLKSYLHNRTHSVVINNFSSKTRTMNAGCPQGLVVGPLLALIYLNDWEGSTENELFFFADDTVLFKAYIHGSAEAELSLSREIWTISCTSVRNGQLPSTPQKQHSKTLRESMKKTSPSLKFGSDLIPIVSNPKHLVYTCLAIC